MLTFLEVTFVTFNICVDKGTFPSALKHADITLIFKRGSSGPKDNYRTVSILPDISKMFEKLLYNQIMPFKD